MILTKYGHNFVEDVAKVTSKISRIEKNFTEKNKKDLYNIAKSYDLNLIKIGGTRVVFKNNHSNKKSVLSKKGVLKINIFKDYFYPESYTKEKSLKKSFSNVKINDSANKNEIINYYAIKNKYPNLFLPVKNYDKNDGFWLIMPYVEKTPTKSEVKTFEKRCDINNLFLPEIKKENCGLNNSHVLCYDYSLPMINTKTMKPVITDYEKAWERLRR
jgi:hypothetical protein